ncbi:MULTISPECIES: hypothetical protein [Thermocrispum]|jgi:hypothetical protein|uniref:Uncharacterized protein n=1 Tax=Thermocrispum agreste TaxID=37925 RepID=A0A2W4L4P5_9PSEU|nr:MULTISPECIES: hypothetical protein [Thermocrispum]PZM95889.1 MAG: hypothetical protein DIU77_11670 [Thermocrispum agreste]
MKWLRRLLGDDLPDGFTGSLDPNEHVLAQADGVVATNRGLWLPEGDGYRHVAWHFVTKATWGDGKLTVVWAQQTQTAGKAVLIADLPPRTFELTQPGKLPAVVHKRVEGSITSRYRKELPDGGGVWFVQRKTPDGPVLQARPDPGTDVDVVAAIAREAADKLVGR